MKKLRNAENYSIGLDIGTGSVGWCVVDNETGQLLTFKGRPTWGSRLFPSAETAASTRLKRGSRRRIQRRRQRLDLLQGFFAEEINKVDPNFFLRLNSSRLVLEDKQDKGINTPWQVFDNAEEEREFRDRFKTIYHLRKSLIENKEKADIRYVYLALHHIVKYRGNFLQQDVPGLSAKSANIDTAARQFVMALEDYALINDIEPCLDLDEFIKAFDPTKKRSEVVDAVTSLHFSSDKVWSKKYELCVKASVGMVADFAKIFDLPDKNSFKLTEEDKVNSLVEVCPEEGLAVFEAIQALYSSWVLVGILGSAEGETISFAKVNEYEQYGKDLQDLKALVKDYVPECYNNFFRGPVDELGRGGYSKNPKKLAGYTKYDFHETSQEDFYKEIKSLLGSVAAGDERYEKALGRMEDFTFLRRLKTSDNGVIPYQLHLEEMKLIINNQKEYYPFLEAEEEKILSLVSFRRPYYVGPLVQENSPKALGKTRFAWAQKREGMEDVPLYPWNWEEVIDKDKAAEDFINRMVKTCSQLPGAAVLPKKSLLYQEFCVLNELNGVSFSDGDKFYRFDYADRCSLVENLFKTGRKIKHSDVNNWHRTHHIGGIEIRGTQGEKNFESRLTSWRMFCDILNVNELSDDQYRMAENIILWCTLFTDKKILKERIGQHYGSQNGGPLSTDQITKIVNKGVNFTEWGRLSRDFLDGITIQTDDGYKTFMDVMREGSSKPGQIGRAMNMNEILADKTLDFESAINEWKMNHAPSEKLKVEDLPGSPAIRREIGQSLKIVKEIVSITKHAPAQIFVEVTRDADAKKKTKRTNKRYDSLAEGLKNLKENSPELYAAVADEFNKSSKDDVSDALYLYFAQAGKCMYSGESLRIENLSNYQIDHIIPQAYVKDDSLENRVLVKPEYNQRKSDSLLLSDEIIRKQSAFWNALNKSHLIGEKKLNNLTRPCIDEKKMKGFIARQLVETSQSVKFVQELLNQDYPDTQVVPIKAGVTSTLRNKCGFVKCREANNYHHAHDAYLACREGLFLKEFYPGFIDNPIGMAHVVKGYINSQAEEFQKYKRVPGDSGCIVGLFTQARVDPNSNKIKFGMLYDKESAEVLWDADEEISNIRKALNLKDCFISRMPEETSGEFWKQTVYSPVMNMKMQPIQRNLKSELYGGYSSERYAYFFMFTAMKKNKLTLQLKGVPLAIATKLRVDNTALLAYAQEVSEDLGMEFVDIRVPKILKYQKVIVDDNLFYITGEREVRNARELAFTDKETLSIKEVLSLVPLKRDQLCDLFDCITLKLESQAPKLGSMLRLQGSNDSFGDLTPANCAMVLSSILGLSNASLNMGNISPLNGLKCAGCIRLSWAALVSKNSKIELVFESSTGMFEKRLKIEI